MASKSYETPKVYLAKSNLADLDTLMIARNELEKLDVEIVEFTGGEYTNIPLINSDYLLIVPPRESMHLSGEHCNRNGECNLDVYVGKGLYTQVKEFIDHPYKSRDNVFVVSKSNGKMLLHRFDNYCIHNQNDFKSEYGKLIVNYSAVWSPNIFKLKAEVYDKPKHKVIAVPENLLTSNSIVVDNRRLLLLCTIV